MLVEAISVHIERMQYYNEQKHVWFLLAHSVKWFIVCFLFKVQTKSELQCILRSCLSVSVVQDVIVVVDIVMLLMCSSDMP